MRWTVLARCFHYLSDGQEIANFRPGTTATHANVQLATGTEQTLPADGVDLVYLGICLVLLQMLLVRAISKVNLDVLNSEEPTGTTLLLQVRLRMAL